MGVSSTPMQKSTPTMKLTDIKCKSVKPQSKQFKLYDGGGLYLLIKPNGGKYWRYKYRLHDKEKLFAIGVYPEISLLDARAKHKDVHRIVSEGNDPNLLKLEEKASKGISNSNTFEAIAREWLEKKQNEIKPQTYKNIVDRLELNLFPKIGKLPIKSVTPPILIQALKTVEKRGAFDTVKRLRQYAGQIFRFAIAHGKADYNPSPDIADALKSKQVEHFKSMPLEMLPDYIKKIESNEARLFKQTCLALKLMNLTFTRKTELSHAKWDEINFVEKAWIVPASRMKMEKEHIVPLSKQALAIFLELKDMNGHMEWVFPSMHKPKKPMNQDTTLRALYKLGYKGVATIHGFRALAMTTIMEVLGYRFEVPDLQLAHSKGDKIRAAYDRTKFLDERTKMMQDWADYLDKISR